MFACSIIDTLDAVLKEVKEYKKQIGLSYNPSGHSLGLSCSIKYEAYDV